MVFIHKDILVPLVQFHADVWTKRSTQDKSLEVDTADLIPLNKV